MKASEKWTFSMRFFYDVFKEGDEVTFPSKMINILENEPVTEPEKLPLHGLGAELQSNWIKPGPERSPVDGPTGRFDPVFKTLKII